MSKAKDAPRERSQPQPGSAPRRARTSLAGPCPRSASHENTKIYRTARNVRFCKCNDCGATWKQAVGEGDPLANYLADLADSLDGADRVNGADGQVIVLSDAVAREVAVQLRQLIAG